MLKQNKELNSNQLSQASGGRISYVELWVDQEVCVACGQCMNNCPTAAIRIERAAWVGKEVALIDMDKCVDCGACMDVCPMSCIYESGRSLR